MGFILLLATIRTFHGDGGKSQCDKNRSANLSQKLKCPKLSIPNQKRSKAKMTKKTQKNILKSFSGIFRHFSLVSIFLLYSFCLLFYTLQLIPLMVLSSFEPMTSHSLSICGRKLLLGLPSLTY
jgi:hypothetical protein